MTFLRTIALTACILTLTASGVTTTALAGPGRSEDPSIAEIASTTAGFETLTAALVAVDLVDFFDGKRHFTVFAPTNEAFAALGLDETNIGTVPADQLTAILLYHVTRGDRNSTSVLASGALRMLDGNLAGTSVTGAGAFINDSQIVVTDIRARNGIVHVISSVLLPPSP